jgi:hypothetical protein
MGRVIAFLLLLLPTAAFGQGGPPPTDVGRVDGVLDMRTQAALARFQLSRNLPAGAQMDRETLQALGVD